MTLTALVSGRTGWCALLVVATSFIVFASLAPDAFTNGDDAVYARQIKSFDYSHRTTHLGYYLIGSPIALVVPDFSDYAMNVMSALFGALTLGTIFLIARALSGSALAAFFSSLFLLTNFVVVYHCVFAEIYISQAFFLILAFLLLIYSRSITGGLAFGLSTLISPSTLLAAPGFALLRPRLEPLVRFGVTAAVVLVLCLSWVLGDYLFGDRGLLSATGGDLDLKSVIKKEGREVVFGILAWLPVLLLGAFELIARRSLRRFGAALLAFWLVIFVLGERFDDVPAQLPTYVLLGVVAGIGVERLVRWMRQSRALGRRFAGIALLAGGAVAPVMVAAAARPLSGTLQRLPSTLLPAAAGMIIAAAAIEALRSPEARFAGLVFPVALALAGGAMTFSLITSHSEEIVRYRETVLRAGSVAQSDHLVVGTWTRGILFNHYLHARPYHEDWIDLQRLQGRLGEASGQQARERWRSALAAGHEIWLLGDYPELLDEARGQHYEVELFGEIYRARSRRLSNPDVAKP